MNLSQLWLIAYTGIGNGNYKYWENQAEVAAWFEEKAFNKALINSVIRGESTNKNAYNYMCVHVPLPYGDVTDCDYISWVNLFEQRRYYAMVNEKEHVNDRSTRLYVEVDYVATYWDELILQNSYVERSHVPFEEDWFDNGTDYLEPLFNYNFDEPIQVSKTLVPNLWVHTDFCSVTDSTLNQDLILGESSGLVALNAKDINAYLRPENYEYNITASIAEDGSLDSPRYVFQCGGGVMGYVYNGSKEQIESMLGAYVSYTTKLLSISEVWSSSIISSYLAPATVSQSRSPQPITFQKSVHWYHLLNFEELPPIKNAKTLSYFTHRMIGNGNYIDKEISDLSSGEINYQITVSGSDEGKLVAAYFNGQTYSGESVESPTWPAVSIAGTQKQQQNNGMDLSMFGLGG